MFRHILYINNTTIIIKKSKYNNWNYLNKHDAIPTYNNTYLIKIN